MKRRHAFTLIEVLLALGLILILLAAMMGFLWELLDRRNTLTRGGRDIQSANAFIERVEADMLAGLAGDSGVGAGVQGTATTLRLLSRGVWLAADPIGQAGGGGGSVSALAASDLQGTEYVFDERSLRLQARRFTYAGASPEPSLFEIVSDRIERVRFRYFDGKVWRDSFDTIKEEKLPVAIEVAVWFTSLGNEVAPPPRAGSARAPAASENASEGKQGTESDDAGPATSLDGLDVKVWGQPDRLRVIIVPDGPQASWSGGT